MALLSLLAVAVVLGVILIVESISNSRKNLPAGVQKLPGPRGYPILGSVPDVPEKNSFLKFHEWGQKYGPVYQCNLAGTNHVWISRDRVAADLLSKRSAIYSDRPHIPALEDDNRTSGKYLPLMSKNELWTRQRKFAKQIMDKSAKASFYGYPELESIRLLFELMTDPSQYNHSLESYIARVTSRLAWGTPTPADELKQRARELLIGVSPTGSLINKLPFAMSLPEKLVPAKAWERRRARTEQKFFTTMQDEVARSISLSSPMSDNKLSQNPQESSAPQSWMRHFLENKSSWGFASDLEGAHAVGMHGIAGALTIAAPMQSFCLAMCHYPQFQPILHEEIDRVLGDRMPKFSDMPDMPVLRAFIRETMRWRPPVPTGIPHELVKDDVYEGYHIPAGSIIHPLEWSISRDPEVFHDPDAFNPLRWLQPEFPTFQEPLSKYPTITSYSQFGYGRRTCQGMDVTEADLFVGIGSMAWMFSMNVIPKNSEEAVPTPSAAELIPTRSKSMKKRARSSVIGLPTGPHTPPEEEQIEAELFGHKLEQELRKVEQAEDYPIISLPGQFPAFFEDKPHTSAQTGIATPSSSPKGKPAMAGRPEMLSVDSMFGRDNSSKPSEKSDPTLDYSSLLIAKPKPFKFGLTIRKQARAEYVAREWMSLKMEGEFEDSRVFWKDGNKGDEMYGWGEVFS